MDTQHGQRGGRRLAKGPIPEEYRQPDSLGKLGKRVAEPADEGSENTDAAVINLWDKVCGFFAGAKDALARHPVSPLLYLTLVAVAACWIVFRGGYTRAYVLQVDGVERGVLASQEDWDAIVTELEEEASGVLGEKYNYKADVTITPVYEAAGMGFSDTGKIETELFDEAGVYQDAWAISVNGQELGCAATEDELQQILVEAAAPYVTEDTESYEFAEEVDIYPVTVPSNTAFNVDEIRAEVLPEQEEPAAAAPAQEISDDGMIDVADAESVADNTAGDSEAAETAAPAETAEPAETAAPEETAAPVETAGPTETAAPEEDGAVAEAVAPVEDSAVADAVSPEMDSEDGEAVDAAVDEEAVAPEEDGEQPEAAGFRLTVITHTSVQVREPVASPVEYIDTDDLYIGDTSVKEQGADGLALVTYDVIAVNGEEQRREPVVTAVIEEPTTTYVYRGTKEKPATASKGYFIWPVEGPLTSYFGTRYIFGSYSSHGGIDIGCPYGTIVSAADGGEVTWAGWQGTYGNLVVITHDDGTQTYYAHNSVLLVSVGDLVYQGQAIAEAGDTGRTTGPHCHFEVRINGTRVDPLDYLS